MEQTEVSKKSNLKKSVQVLFSNNTQHVLKRTHLFMNEGNWVTEPAEVVSGPGTVTFSCVAQTEIEGVNGGVVFSSPSQMQIKLSWNSPANGPKSFSGDLADGTGFHIEQKQIEGDASIVTFILAETQQKEKLDHHPLESLHISSPLEAKHEFLTYNQEWYLKKLTIRHTIDKELAEFSAHPTKENIYKSELLSFIYEQCFLGFPLFKQKQGMNSKVDELLVQYPKFKALAIKSTKADEQRYPLAVSVFDLCIKIPSEATASIPSDAQRKEIQENLQLLMDDINKDGVKEVFRKIAAAKRISDLPQSYRNVFTSVHKQIIPKIFDELRDPKKMSKATTLYNITPKGPLKTILGMTNPLKMMGSLLTLFLARPLGSRNLLQRLMEVVTDFSKTEKQLKEAKKGIDKLIVQKVQSWVTEHYNPTPSVDIDDKSTPEIAGIKNPKEFVVRLLVDEKSKPKLDVNSITKLTADLVQKIYELAALEMRMKDKQEFVELLGDEGLTSVIKEIFPVLYHPLIEIYSNSDMPALLTAFFKMSKQTIELMNAKDHDDKIKLENLSTTAETFEEAVFLFVRQVIKEDKGELEQIFSWGSSFFTSGYSMVVNFQELLQKQNPDDQKEIIREVNEWIEYKAYERHKLSNAEPLTKKPPQQHFIPKVLVDPFLAVVKPYLENIRKKDKK